MTEEKKELVMITVERSNFELSKVTFNGKTVYVEGTVQMSVNGGILQRKNIKETVDSFPAPDFVEALLALKPRLLEEWNFLFPIETMKAFVEMKDIEKGLTADESKIIMELEIFMQDQLQKESEKITVIGASVAGKSKGIAINGKNKQDDRQLEMKMPRRSFVYDSGVEENELYIMWTHLEDEVFDLLYKGKQAQQSAFGVTAPDAEQGTMDLEDSAETSDDARAEE